MAIKKSVRRAGVWLILELACDWRHHLLLLLRLMRGACFFIAMQVVEGQTGLAASP